MSKLPQKLRRYPRLFDRLNRLHRSIRKPPALYRELARHLPPGAPFQFLQVGANDGITHDPFREFMIRPQARGVTVEPVPDFFKSLQRNYRYYPRVATVNCAVGYPSGLLPFYTFRRSYLESQPDAAELAGLASFNREKLLARLGGGEPPGLCIEELQIPVRTVEEIMDEHDFDAFDCLFLDCEGHEENILTGMDYKLARPRLIVFEHSHYGERAEVIEAHLKQHGFAFTRLAFDTVAHRQANR